MLKGMTYGQTSPGFVCHTCMIKQCLTMCHRLNTVKNLIACADFCAPYHWSQYETSSDELGAVFVVPCC